MEGSSDLSTSLTSTLVGVTAIKQNEMDSPTQTPEQVWQKVVPIPTMLLDIKRQHLDKSLMESFHQSISLGVITQCFHLYHFHEMTHFSNKIGNEIIPPVRKVDILECHDDKCPPQLTISPLSQHVGWLQRRLLPILSKSQGAQPHTGERLFLFPHVSTHTSPPTAPS